MTSHLRSGIVGIIHRAGNDWRLVAADLSGSRPKILGSQAMPASTSPDQLGAWLDEQKVTAALQIVPASASVCRTFILPNADDEELHQALRLQAETWLLAGTPEHRYGGGVLPSAPGESNRTGVAFAWPEAASTAVDAAALTTPSRWVPEAAALTALLDGERPAEPIVSLDRRRGSLGLVLCHPGGASVRGTAAELTTPDWTKAIRRIVVETALADDHTTGFATRIADDVIGDVTSLADSDAACLVPDGLLDAVRRRFTDAPADAAWWRTFGVAAGAILAATGPMASAADLQRDATVVRASRWRSLAASIARPRTAVAAASVALVIAALAGPASARLRLMLLESRYGDLSDLRAEVDAADTRMAIYTASADDGLPMSKLLGDIACNTPIGVELEFVSINAASRQFLVRGSSLTKSDVSGRERTVEMQDSFGRSGLFAQLAPQWEVEESKVTPGYVLRLQGNIVDPHRRIDYAIEQDFGRWTAWQRRQGEPPPSDDEAVVADAGDGANTNDGGDSGPGSGGSADIVAISDRDPRPTRPVGRPSGTSRPSGDTSRPGSGGGSGFDTTAIPEAGSTSGAGSRPDRGGPTTVGAGGSGLDADAQEVKDGGGTGSFVVPPPLSEAVVAVMDRTEAMAAFVELSKARAQLRRIEGEEELKARLESEYKMIQARVLELRKAGS